MESEIDKIMNRIEKRWYKLQETTYEDVESVPFDDLLEIVRKVLQREFKEHYSNKTTIDEDGRKVHKIKWW